MAITKLPDVAAGDASLLLGKECFLRVNTGENTTTPKWTVVGGQKSTSLKFTADEIDATHKTSGGYKSTLQGLKSWSMDADALVILSDEGVEALQFAFLNSKPVHCQLWAGKGRPAYTGNAAVTSFSLDTPDSGPASLSITLSGMGPLTIEDGKA